MSEMEDDVSALCKDCLKRGKKILADRNGLCRGCNQNRSDCDLASPIPRLVIRDEKPLPGLPRPSKPFVPPAPKENRTERPLAFREPLRVPPPDLPKKESAIPPTSRPDPKDNLRQVLDYPTLKATLELLRSEAESTLQILSLPKVQAFIQKLKPDEQANIHEMTRQIARISLDLATLK